jgi:hypothetical protein
MKEKIRTVTLQLHIKNKTLIYQISFKSLGPELIEKLNRICDILSRMKALAKKRKCNYSFNIVLQVL